MDDCELRRVVELFEFWNHDARPEIAEAAHATGIGEEQMMGMTSFIGLPGTMTDDMRKNIEWAEEMKAKMKHGAN